MDIQNNQTQELFEKLYVKNTPSWALERDSDGSYKYHATQSAFSLFEQQQAEIELLKSDLAKAQAVPERTNQTFEDWLSDSENTKVYFGGYRERANEFAHQAWMASLKAKIPKDKILMPRSLDQKHIDYVVHQLAISSGASLISEVYECLIEAQEPK